MATKKPSAAKKAVEVSAGILAAAAAAGAGYYFYGDTKAKKHRAAASKWAKGLKADVIKETKKLEKVSQKGITSIVDKAAKTYSMAKSVDKKDLDAAAKELKRHWKMVEAEVQAISKKVATAKKSATKAVKKAVAPKKAVKKAPKKAAKKTK